VAEDDLFQRETLASYLIKQGYRVTEAEGGANLRQLMGQSKQGSTVDIVILDVHMPGEDGFSLARYLRERDPSCGIIMLTAASDEVDRVVGLESGAADYVVKPFNPRELVARIKSVMRRIGPARPAAAGRVKIGTTLLDLDAHKLFAADGAEVTITATEFDMLRVVAENPNRVLSCERLLELSSQRELDTCDRSIDIRVARLRKKLESDPDKPQTIRTIRGAGYMFVPA